MAVYKVPQDVEADDKLIGPFSFRQFVYLLIAAGLIALAVGLFQIFPLLAIIPLPPVLLFLALALPLKKDQPMETYLAALVQYYLKPRTRLWTSGQRESTILITAPKIVEDVRTRDLSQEEATHRLSFLADIVDTGGYAIKGAANKNMREDLVAEAEATTDMFDSYSAVNLNRAIDQEKQQRHAEAIREMQEAINRNETGLGITPLPEARKTVGAGVVVKPKIIKENQRAEIRHDATQTQPDEARRSEKVVQPVTKAETAQQPARSAEKVVQPSVISEVERIEKEAEEEIMKPKTVLPKAARPVEKNTVEPRVTLGAAQEENPEAGAVIIMPDVKGMRSKKDLKKKTPDEMLDETMTAETNVDNVKIDETTQPKASIIELANNSDFSIATIAKEANRINERDDGEVFISLH